MIPAISIISDGMRRAAQDGRPLNSWLVTGAVFRQIEAIGLARQAGCSGEGIELQGDLARAVRMAVLDGGPCVAAAAAEALGQVRTINS